MTVTLFLSGLAIGSIIAIVFGVVGAIWDHQTESRWRREIDLPPLPRRIPKQPEGEHDSDGA